VMLKGICVCFYCQNCFVGSLPRVFAEFMERVIYVDFDIDLYYFVYLRPGIYKNTGLKPSASVTCCKTRYIIY